MSYDHCHKGLFQPKATLAFDVAKVFKLPRHDTV